MTKPNPTQGTPSELSDELNERVVLVAVDFTDRAYRSTAGGYDSEEADRSLEELALLAESAGAEVVATAMQRRDRPDFATYVGKGKLQEICDAAEALDADTIIFDDELSGAQIRNLEKAAGRKILDRTLLILDIFAERAKSKEGRLQVELAQQQYRLSRLSGMGLSLSRQGGGIGTRGPGETKLESDRRHIARRVHTLHVAIDDIQVNRARTREARHKGNVFSIAFVGYTNAGKSTLINALCETDLYTEDRVFATLDPAVRQLPLEASVPTVAVDTVGFIRKLPHHLIEAFKSTLEEAILADLLVHVVDASDPNRMRQIHVVEGILDALGASDVPLVTVFNKIDRIRTDAPEDVIPLHDTLPADQAIEVSAKQGTGLDTLRDVLRQKADSSVVLVEIHIPYAEAGTLDRLHRAGRVESTLYKETYIEVRMSVSQTVLGRLAPYHPMIV